MKKFLFVLLIFTMIAAAAFSEGKKEEPVTESAAEPAMEPAKEPVMTGPYAPNQTATAYSYIHGGYVGKAVVKTDSNG